MISYFCACMSKHGLARCARAQSASQYFLSQNRSKPGSENFQASMTRQKTEVDAQELKYKR